MDLLCTSVCQKEHYSPCLAWRLRKLVEAPKNFFSVGRDTSLKLHQVQRKPKAGGKVPVSSVISEASWAIAWFMQRLRSLSLCILWLCYEANEVKLPASLYSWVSPPPSLEASLATVVILLPLRQMEDAEVSCLLVRMKTSELVLPCVWTEEPGERMMKFPFVDCQSWSCWGI